jgi:hypothetical protein
LGKKNYLNIKCLFWFSLQLCNFSHSMQNRRNMIKMSIGLHVKYPLFLSDFNGPGIILDILSKTPQIPNFMKTCPVGASDMIELIVAFRNSAKAPNLDLSCPHTPHAPRSIWVSVSE